MMRAVRQGGIRFHPQGNDRYNKSFVHVDDMEMCVVDIPLGEQREGVIHDPHSLSKGEQEQLCRGYVRQLAKYRSDHWCTCSRCYDKRSAHALDDGWVWDYSRRTLSRNNYRKACRDGRFARTHSGYGIRCYLLSQRSPKRIEDRYHKNNRKLQGLEMLLNMRQDCIPRWAER